MRPDKDYFVVGIILEKIYDSEIHLSVGWMYDGGFDYKIGADLSYIDGKVESTGTDNIKEAMIMIAGEVSKAYPDSEFTKWWNDFSV